MHKLLLSCVVWSAILGGVYGSAWGQAVSDTAQARTSAPTFVLKSLDGDLVFLRDYCGQTLRKPHTKKHVVVLSFFASWCIPCKTEIPILQQVYESFKDKPVKFFLINYTVAEHETTAHQANDDPQQRLTLASTFVKTQRYTLPVLLDEFGIAARNLQIADERGRVEIPYLIVLDRNGQVRMSHKGFNVSPQEFKQELDKTITSLLQDSL